MNHKILIAPMAIALMSALTVTSAQAAPKAKGATVAAKVMKPIQLPNPYTAGYMPEAELRNRSEDLKKSKSRFPAANGVSASGITEEAMSPELRKFRDRFIAVKDGQALADLLAEYDNDANYAKYPADLQFFVARMATFIPFRGVIWRMAPLVHQAISLQESLLATIRNMAEQVNIRDSKSHLPAQIVFFSAPYDALVGKGKNAPDKTFKTEADFVSFLGNEVAPSLDRAIKRLEAIKEMAWDKDGKKLPIVLDAKIRIGESAFPKDAYQASDRFKVQGEAEREATLARYHRRLAQIYQVGAFNWQGHLALRKEIGKLYGIDIEKSTLEDTKMARMLDRDHSDDAYIFGVTREARVDVQRKPAYANLYRLISRENLKNAYYHLHRHYVHLQNAWNVIKAENRGADEMYQLDPEVFVARAEQVEEGLHNLEKLFGKIDDEDPAKNASGKVASVSGATSIQGAFSGDSVKIDVKNFYEKGCPDSLWALLPVEKGFAKNEDLNFLLQSDYYKGLGTKLSPNSDMVSMNINGKKVSWRNYFYGRATTWNSAAYAGIFTDLGGQSVGDAVRILGEARGARMITSSIGMFIR